ncbi:MAG: hypothetical protein JNJ60_02440 [Rhodocyclaceae bacterium]|nr:hypothetical protein [Rhodocyclaceae bacterium]
MNVIHLAYSDHEVQMLRAAGIQGEVIHFKNEVRARWSKMDQVDPELLRSIDRDVLEQTRGAFTLNGIIQSDRGFNLLNNEECLRLCAAYYEFWDQLIRERSVNYILHETPSLVFNFIGVILCSKYGGQYLYNIMVPSEPGAFDYLAMNGFDFTCDDLNLAMEQVRRGQLKIDHERCSRFLAGYRKDLSVFLGSSISRNTQFPRLFAICMRNIARSVLRRNRFDRHIDNIDYWEIRRNVAGQKIINLLRYKFQVEFSDFDPTRAYYFYPFQLEPEAGVHYQGHGIYMNQVKLIQNIAAQLPPGTYLYVKDHPHDHGYRPATDYLRLTNIPNVCLLRSEIPAKQVISRARGVMTITGTAGFEAIMMGKQVYCFGKTFYSSCPQVTYVHNIRELRAAIYANENIDYRDEETLFPFLTAFLAAKKQGLIDYYGGRASKYGIDLKENARKIAQMLVDNASR